MKRYLSVLLMFLAVAAFAACGGDKESDEHHDDDGHEHEDGHDDHDGHDHKDGEHEGDEHGDHGERHEVGKGQAGAFTVSLAVFGEIEAGHEAVLDVEVAGGTCTALRAWVGVESGKGSLKTKIDGEDGDYHGHIEVPATLAQGSAIWIELEGTDGKKSRTSFKLP